MSATESPKTSDAIVFRGPDQPLQLEQLPLPDLKDQEVLVRVLCCTICGSDVHTFSGHRGTPVPTILGHEILGEVVAIGPGAAIAGINGATIELGMRVTWSVVAHCGDCFFCQRELPQKCLGLFKYGHRSLQPEHQLSGGLAEYCHLKAGTQLLPVPPHLPTHVVTPANCATATIAGAMRTAGSVTDCHLLVQGAGMLGLTAAAMASAAGAASVVVTDISSERLERARQFGADHVVLMGGEGNALVETVAKVTDGHGMDVAIDVCGAAEAVQAGLDSLRIGGIQVLVGSVFPGPPLALDLEDVVRRMLTIRGLHNYTPADLVAAVEFLEEYHQQFPFGELVTSSYSLADVSSAFAAAADPRSLRIAVEPSSSFVHC